VSPTQFPIVTICGSMRFYPEMLEVAKGLTSEGWIVLMPHENYNNGVKVPGDKHADMLDDMHKTKISMSERICVVASGKADIFHVGESTTDEIHYAKDHQIEVFYWTQHFGMVPEIEVYPPRSQRL
jgi:hypothetical protein